MSRLFAIASHEPRQSAAFMDAMARRDDPEGVTFTHTLTDPSEHWTIGRAERARRPRATPIASAADLHVMVDGLIHNDADLRRGLEQHEPAQPTDVNSLTAALYRRSGTDWLAKARGTFCGIVIDARAGRVTLFSDLIGSRPLFWHHAGGRLLAGSSVQSLLADSKVPRRLDPHAVADYLTFGFLMGNKTLNQGVHVLAPGSTLTYDWTTDSLRIERYASTADLFRSDFANRADYHAALTDTFARAAERASRVEGEICLSLSGGLDSRTVLCALNGRRHHVSTYTVGVRNCADQAIAERLSSLAGTRHRFIELEEGSLEDFVPGFRRMVSLSDGMYLSHGLTEGLVLDYVQGSHYSAMLRGHGGELAKMSLAWPLHTDEQVRAMSGKAPLIDYLLSRMHHVSTDSLRDIFVPEWQGAVAGQARRSLETSLDTLDLCPQDLCCYLYLMEHHRRFTLPALAPLERVLSVQLPFADPDFLGVLFAGNPAWRDGTDVHRAIMSALAPELLAVRNSNTGAPGNAGPLREAFMDKVNTLLRRLGAPGYRHYHSFERWMRDKFLESVETTLLAGDAADRGIFEPSAVRRRIDETRAGSSDHAHLLGVLLILELWQQEAV